MIITKKRLLHHEKNDYLVRVLRRRVEAAGAGLLTERARDLKGALLAGDLEAARLAGDFEAARLAGDLVRFSGVPGALTTTCGTETTSTTSAFLAADLRETRAAGLASALAALRTGETSFSTTLTDFFSATFLAAFLSS